MHGNVWEWVEDCWNDSYKGAPERRQRLDERRLQPPGAARGLLGRQSGDPPLRRPLQGQHRRPGQHVGFRVARTLSRERERYPLNLHSFTPWGLGRSPVEVSGDPGIGSERLNEGPHGRVHSFYLTAASPLSRRTTLSSPFLIEASPPSRWTTLGPPSLTEVSPRSWFTAIPYLVTTGAAPLSPQTPAARAGLWPRAARARIPTVAWTMGHRERSDQRLTKG